MTTGNNRWVMPDGFRDELGLNRPEVYNKEAPKAPQSTYQLQGEVVSILSGTNDLSTLNGWLVRLSVPECSTPLKANTELMVYFAAIKDDPELLEEMAKILMESKVSKIRNAAYGVLGEMRLARGVPVEIDEVEKANTHPYLNEWIGKNNLSELLKLEKNFAESVNGKAIPVSDEELEALMNELCAVSKSVNNPRVHPRLDSVRSISLYNNGKIYDLYVAPKNDGFWEVHRLSEDLTKTALESPELKRVSKGLIDCLQAENMLDRALRSSGSLSSIPIEIFPSEWDKFVVPVTSIVSGGDPGENLSIQVLEKNGQKRKCFLGFKKNENDEWVVSYVSMQ